MIRRADLSDSDRIYEIYNQAFFEPISKKHLIKDIENNSLLRHYVLVEEGQVVAFYVASYILDEVEIFTIAVAEGHKREGKGLALLDHLVNEAKSEDMKKIFLEVSTKNEPAISLYERVGFKILGIRKNYYQKLGEDAYNMKRKLYE